MWLWYNFFGMDNFKREVRNNLLIFGGIVVVFVGFILVAKGQVTGISSRIAGAQSLINQQRTISSQLIELREENELAEKYEKVINVLIPTDKQIFGLEDWLEAQAQVHGVNISFDYAGSQTDPVEGGLGSFPFSMKLTGNISNIVDLMDFLENKSYQYIMAFAEMSVGATKDGSSQVVLKGQVYFRTTDNE